MFRIFLMFLCLWFPQDAGIRYRIIKMDSAEITIGGEKKRIGDEFKENETILWTYPSQTITAVNLTTKTLFCFSASSNKVSEKLALDGIINIERSLSTESMMPIESDMDVRQDHSFFYIIFENKGQNEIVPLLRHGEVEGMHGTVYLVRHDHINKREILVSEDFMTLEDILTQADTKAKDMIEASGRIYYESDLEVMIKDYMDLMHKLTKKYFGDIECTYEELKILMSTK